MNVIALQEKIVAHPEYIEKLCEDMGFENIRDRGEYYSMQNIGGDNPSAIAIYKDNLHYENFSHGSSGNIFTLTMETKHCSFPESLEYVSEVLGIKAENIKIVLPFGGFYKNISKKKSDEFEELPHYSESNLPPPDSLSQKFLDDGVSLQVQYKMGVRYSHEDDAILIPVYDMEHNLVGCKGRSNDPNVDSSKRWFMYIPYKKSHIVYGLDVNYKSIITRSMIVIFEAEKSVMQCLSFEFNMATGIGGHSISKVQAKYIKMTAAKKVIVAFDEGLEEGEVKYEAKKLLVNTERYTNKVYYIYDREHKYLPKGSKMSPSDQGKEVFLKLLKNCLHEVKNE